MNTYTEEEMKQKWCPHATLVLDSEGYASGNRHSAAGNSICELPKECRCIASKCSQWQWREYNDSGNKIPQGIQPSKGYCGLARK